MRILDVRGKSLAEIDKLSIQRYRAQYYRMISTEQRQRETTDADIKEFQKRAEKEGAVAIFIQEYGLMAFIPIATKFVKDDLAQSKETELKHFWVEMNPEGSWAIVEAFPSGTVRSPFKTNVEAIKREHEIGAEYEWNLKQVPSPQEKFPKQHEVLKGFYPYEIIEYHDDGDLTIQSFEPLPRPKVGFKKGYIFVVTTDGKIFKQERLPQSSVGTLVPQTSRDPIIEKGREYWSKVNATQKAIMQRMRASRVLEVHSDGDLTFEAEGGIYVLTTSGELFVKAPAGEGNGHGVLPQTDIGAPIPSEHRDLFRHPKPLPKDAY